MPQPLVTVIILNWNSADRTIACIETLRGVAYDNMRIHVVDNGSTDGSADRLSHLEGVNFSQNPVNLGYTGGNNQAMYEAVTAGTDYVWLLNNDTVVPQDCLAGLVSVAEAAPDVGLVSPVIRDNDSTGAIQACCGIPDPHYPQWKLIRDVKEAVMAQQNENGRLILYGTALLVKRSVMEKVGYLDDRLFAYCEDYDYSIRSIQGGFKNVVAVDACVFHDAVTDNGRKAYYFYLISRNYLLVARKHSNISRYWRYVWWRYQIGRGIAANGSSRTQADAYLTGWWDGVRGRGGPFFPPRSIPAAVRWALFPRSHIRTMD